jgi:glutamate dehydrogenase/leucine dehydrogenase
LPARRQGSVNQGDRVNTLPIDDAALRVGRLARGMRAYDAEQTIIRDEDVPGLRSVIVVGDTTLGPALGGVRLWPYESTDAALADTLRLAGAMTIKAALARVRLGGGASVLLIDEDVVDRNDALRAHGRLLGTLGGRFIPVNDVGTSQDDIAVIGREIAPVPDRWDPSVYTALGVLESIRAALGHLDARRRLAGRRVVVQGAGHVGSALVAMLRAESAEVLICDCDEMHARKLARRYGSTVIDPEDAIAADCDVLAPCALGAVITPQTVARLGCRIVAGAANNVLSDLALAEDLAARGIVYVPDFLANAGGLIFLDGQLRSNALAASARVSRIGRTVAAALDLAGRDAKTPLDVAIEIAELRLNRAGRAHPRAAIATGR